MTKVNIYFHDDLLRAVDDIAKQETRTRSELLTEAAGMYIERKRRWEEIFSYGRKQVLGNNIREDDILNEIRTCRQTKTKN